jgi:hypothetical protein
LSHGDTSGAAEYGARRELVNDEGEEHAGPMQQCRLHRPPHCDKGRFGAIEADHDRRSGAPGDSGHLLLPIRTRTCGHPDRRPIAELTT